MFQEITVWFWRVKQNASKRVTDGIFQNESKTSSEKHYQVRVQKLQQKSDGFLSPDLTTEQYHYWLKFGNLSKKIVLMRSFGSEAISRFFKYFVENRNLQNVIRLSQCMEISDFENFRHEKHFSVDGKYDLKLQNQMKVKSQLILMLFGVICETRKNSRILQNPHVLQMANF